MATLHLVMLIKCFKCFKNDYISNGLFFSASLYCVVHLSSKPEAFGLHKLSVINLFAVDDKTAKSHQEHLLWLVTVAPIAVTFQNLCSICVRYERFHWTQPVLNHSLIAGWWCVKPFRPPDRWAVTQQREPCWNPPPPRRELWPWTAPTVSAQRGTEDLTRRRIAPTPMRWRGSFQVRPTFPIHLTPPTR